MTTKGIDGLLLETRNWGKVDKSPSRLRFRSEARSEPQSVAAEPTGVRVALWGALHT
jgi:hypothetical protein